MDETHLSMHMKIGSTTKAVSLQRAIGGVTLFQQHICQFGLLLPLTFGVEATCRLLYYCCVPSVVNWQTRSCSKEILISSTKQFSVIRGRDLQL
jgi:hypothetical protein